MSAVGLGHTTSLWLEYSLPLRSLMAAKNYLPSINLTVSTLTPKNYSWYPPRTTSRELGIKTNKNKQEFSISFYCGKELKIKKQVDMDVYTLSEKKCWNDVDFPHILRFWHFPPCLEVSYSSHIWCGLPTSNQMPSIRWKMHIEIKLLILCGISSACRLRWQVHIITMISLVECRYVLV